MLYISKSVVATGVVTFLLSPTFLSSPRADTLYQQASAFPDGNRGLSSQFDTGSLIGGLLYRAYDDFTLDQRGDITDLTWQGTFSSRTHGPITAFTVIFWSDNNGLPDVPLSTQIIPGHANEKYVGDLLGLSFFPTYDYHASLSTAFSAEAGTRYWLSVVPDLEFPPQWFWGESVPANAQAAQDILGLAGVQPQDVDLTFALLSGPPPASVPEPTALFWAAGMSTTGFLLCLRRRKLRRKHFSKP